MLRHLDATGVLHSHTSLFGLAISPTVHSYVWLMAPYWTAWGWSRSRILARFPDTYREKRLKLNYLQRQLDSTPVA